MSLAIIALTLVGLVEAGMLWYVARGLRRLDGVETRVGHLADAVALLTEAAEAGFRSNASEIGRMAEQAVAGAATPSALATRRMATAARKGRPAGDIAAAEGVSEGEVNLRLHLAKSAASRRQKAKASKEAGSGALRS